MTGALVNVALKKPTAQSPADSPEHQTPDRAVDGERRSTAAFQTRRERNPWWQVDLGLCVPLERIVIYNACGPSASLTGDFSVVTSTDGATWKCIYKAVNRFGGLDDNAPLTLNISGQVSGRIVRCQVNGRGSVGLSQVEIYVKPENLVLAEAISASGTDTKAFFDGVLKPYSELEFTPPSRPRVQALGVTYFGKYGNCVVCLTNALTVAHSIGVRRIYFDGTALDGELDLTQGATDSSIQILPYTDPSRHEFGLLSGSFFRLDAFPAVRDSVSERERRDLALRYIVPLLNPRLSKTAPPAPDLVCVHIRSGDIFRGRNAPGYIQPPLAFYQLALQRALDQGCRRVLLVSENKLNPVIDPLVEWCRSKALDLTVSMSSFDVDLQHLYAAHNLILSRSTLMEALFLTSTNLQKVTIFENPELAQRARALGLDVQYLVDEGKEYTPRGSWHNTDEQRDLMLSYPAQKLQWEASS